MSYQHTQAALEFKLPTSVKCLLLVMAARCCGACGLTWLGMRRLTDETGLSERTLRDCLHRLVTQELVHIHAYPKGGRGRATEYIVLPGLPGLSTAPCGECRSRMRNPAPRAGYNRSVTSLETKPGNHPGVYGQGTVKRRQPNVKTRQTGTDQQSVEEQQSGTDPSVPGEVEARPSGAPDTLTATPHYPSSAQEALKLIDEMTSKLGTHLTLPGTESPPRKTPA